MISVPGGIDGLEVRFDDGSLVADAGLLLAGTVMDRLGLEAMLDEAVRPAGSVGSGSGRKVLTLAASMLVGGSFIGDADRLRAGSASAVLPFTPLAPSTLGALRVSGRGEGVEQRPVGFACVEECADSVVGEVGESERGAFDAFDEVVGWQALPVVASQLSVDAVG